MLFRGNVSQVKLDNISILFKFNLTSHYLSDIQIPSALFTKFMTKSEYMKHRKQPLWGFLQNSFYGTLTLK